MTKFEQLSNAAYHAEKVAARRLVRQTGLTEMQALTQILLAVAGAEDLWLLVAKREAHIQAEVQRRALRRQRQQDAYQYKQSKNQPLADAWLAWFDGSARPNPGRCGIGGVLQGPNGEYFEVCELAGDGSSSDAEYRALIALLALAVPLQPARLVVYGDSQVVITDAGQSDADASAVLQTHRACAQALLARLPEVRLCWIPRHKNSMADALSQRASNLVLAL